MIARMTDEQLDDRVRAYLNYRAEQIAGRAASADIATDVLAQRLGLRSTRATPNLRLARVAIALLLLLLSLFAAVYVGSVLFRERYAPIEQRVEAPVDGDAWAVTGAYGSIWVGAGTFPAGVVYQLDPSDGAVRNQVQAMTSICGDIARGYGALYFSYCGTHAMSRLDARTLKLDRLIGYGSDSLGIGAESIWATDGANVARLDPITLATQAVIPVGGEALVTFGGESAWAIVTDAGRVARIDPRTNSVTAMIELSPAPAERAIPVHGTVAAGALWVVDELGATIYRIDLQDNSVSVVPIDFADENSAGMEFGDWYITSGRGLLWFRNSTDKIIAIDPSTYQVASTIETTGGVGGFFVADDSLWVGNGEDGSVTGMRLP